MTAIIYINNLEIILLLLSLVTIFIVALKTLKSLKNSFILTLLLIPALYLSVEGTTQFLTNDSSYGIYEIITIENSSLRHWHEGSYKTSIAAVGTLLNLLKKYTYMGMKMDNTDFKMLAKAIHWFICMLTLIAMYYFIDKYYIPTKQKSIYFLIYFYSLLLLPSNLFAFKIITYDPFSLILGGLAVVLALIALKSQKATFAVASIVFATLATQEKAIAAPVLLFTMFVLTYVNIQSCVDKFSLKTCLLFSLPASFYAIMIAFLTQIMTFLVVFIIVKPESINSIFTITFSSLMMPVAAGLNYLKISGSYLYKFYMLIVLLPAIVIGLMLIQQQINFARLKHQLNIISAASLLAVLAAFVIGIITPIFVSLVLLPTSIPYTGDDYLSPRIFNSFQKYFIGVKTYYGYAVANIGYAYRTFIIYIPSVYLLLIAFLFWNGYKNKRQLLTWEIVLLAALVMPIFYGISDVPLSGGGRYFNLYLLLMVLPLGLKLIYSLEEYRPTGKWLVTGVFLMVILIEVLPFRPFFAHFNHIWRNNFTWGGWGEEYFLVGKQIEHLVATGKMASAEQIVLHGTYSGVWLNKHFAGQVKYRKMGCRFSKSDYYIITRQVIGDRLHDIRPYFKEMTFLENIKPVFTVSQWGRAYVWVYRGDQIKHKANLVNCQKLQEK